jgi:molybdopterin synthase catalytic subunit
MIEITDCPINFDTVFSRLNKENSGSIVIHYAIVRSTEAGKKTTSMKFELDGDAEGEMKELEKTLRSKWQVEDVLLIRRIGELSIGDIISVAAASSEHRESAFGLCQEAVNSFKKMKTFKKKEIFERPEK